MTFRFYPNKKGMQKATIKIVTAEKEFRQDQVAIMKRVVMVLEAHDLSVAVAMKQKVEHNDRLPRLKLA